MDEGDRDKFAGTIAMLAATFRQEISTPMLEGYWLGLEDLPLDDIRASCVKAIKECKFMPSVREIRVRTGSFARLSHPAYRAIPERTPEEIEWRKAREQGYIKDGGGG